MTPANVQRGLRVDDILGREISIQWTEAVALVGAACRQVVANGAPGFPAASQVVVYPEGAVAALGTFDQHPVRGAAQLLTSLLADEVPVRVRLMLSQATGTDIAYTTLKEFSDALAYFERPGSDTILQALYARAAAASRVSGAAPPTLNAVAPLPAPDQPKPARRPDETRSKARTLKLAAAVVILLSFCAAGAWYARSAAGERNASAVTLEASNTVGDALLSGLSAVTERSGLGRLVPAAEATVETPAVPDLPATKQPRLRRAPPSPEPPGVPIIVFDLDPPPNTGTVASAAANRTSTLSRDVTAEGAAVNAELIFSSDSEGVSPPVDVRPQLPSELPPNLTTEQLSRVELIVSEAGTVDSVKLLGKPRTVHDFMFLSAAKAWQFHPALKDGVPVRYRKTVWIASQ